MATDRSVALKAADANGFIETSSSSGKLRDVAGRLSVVRYCAQTVLTPDEVAAHEGKFKRLFMWDAVWALLLVIGLNLEDGGADFFLGPAVLVFVVQGLRWYAYVMKDLRLRGRSQVWVYFVFGPVGFALWLSWRRKYPIPTRDTVGRPRE